MEVIDSFLRNGKEQNPDELAKKLNDAVGVLSGKIKSITDQQNFSSFEVLVSGRGEVFNAGITKLIAEVGKDLPEGLTHALKHPMMLGEEFNDVYTSVLGGEVKRYIFEQRIGEENTQRLLDKPNQLVLYVDDHIGTGRKALSVIQAVEPHLQNRSQVYFAAPVIKPGRSIDVHPQIKVGSNDEQLFNFLQKDHWV